MPPGLALRIPAATHTRGIVVRAALVHDVGKLVLSTRPPRHFARALFEAHWGQVPLYANERQLAGVTHAKVGAYLLADIARLPLWRPSRIPITLKPLFRTTFSILSASSRSPTSSLTKLQPAPATPVPFRIKPLSPDISTASALPTSIAIGWKWPTPWPLTRLPLADVRRLTRSPSRHPMAAPRPTFQSPFGAGSL